MRIAIGCDHRGLDIKQFVISLVGDSGHSVEDFGCYTADPVDYPDIAREVALAVAGGDCTHGILICNTGIGMSIAANKLKGIRAALCCSVFDACRARQHNDANILCLSAERDRGSISEIVKAYLTSEFQGGRHLLRVNKIMAMED
ncbi:MAG: ribose 5-phosphate isomerase B [Dehalococcoidales bacterium]|nr:ribose 5-phosphate isomerase B [Dehalococcoidales bacterium]